MSGHLPKMPAMHRACLLPFLLASLLAPAWALDQPEAATTRTAKPGSLTAPARHFAVTAANPLAAQAGVQILKAGGSAMDAAVAVQAVLGLVEPQSSGIAGGAFLLHWDGRQVQALDGRENAPAAATPQMFLRPDGRPLPMREAILSGLSTGTPGVLAMLAEGHRLHGRLPWARLFEPAIALAEQGFAISPRLFELASAEAALRSDAQASGYFFDAAGAPKPVGTVLKNPAYAAVLRGIARQGVKAFYEGPVAEDIVRRVKAHARPGLLSVADLAGYRPVLRPPLCNDGAPPAAVQRLAQLSRLRLRAAHVGAPDADADPGLAGHPARGPLGTGADGRLAACLCRVRQAGLRRPRAVHRRPGLRHGAGWRLAPPAGAGLPEGAPAYLKERGALIGERAMPPATAGDPGALRRALAPQAEQLESGTSHISIVDAQGRAVAMTTSVESAFGNRVMSDGGTGLAGGFMLNNQLTDFSLNPVGADGRPVANRVEAGKRPRSSMAPTLVFDRDGKLLMVAGSPGGPVIIHYVAKVLTGALAWGLPVQQAVDLPNFGHFNGGALIVERGALTAAQLADLRGRGHNVVETDLTSGLQVLMRVDGEQGGWAGGADPRREGVVKGE